MSSRLTFDRVRLTLKQCIALYEKGYGLDHIAEKSGVSKATLWRSFKRAGVQLRNSAPSPRYLKKRWGKEMKL